MSAARVMGGILIRGAMMRLVRECYTISSMREDYNISTISDVFHGKCGCRGRAEAMLGAKVGKDSGTV